MGRLQGAALGEKGAISIRGIKFLVSLIGRSKGWMLLHKPGCQRGIGGNNGYRTW